jgi:hypothetical protein
VQQFHEDVELLKHLNDVEVKPDDKLSNVTARILPRLHHHRIEQFQLMAATAVQDSSTSATSPIISLRELLALSRHQTRRTALDLRNYTNYTLRRYSPSAATALPK